jgi:hypothetical protein
MCSNKLFVWIDVATTNASIGDLAFLHLVVMLKQFCVMKKFLQTSRTWKENHRIVTLAYVNLAEFHLGTNKPHEVKSFYEVALHIYGKLGAGYATPLRHRSWVGWHCIHSRWIEWERDHPFPSPTCFQHSWQITKWHVGQRINIFFLYKMKYPCSRKCILTSFNIAIWCGGWFL